LAVLPRRPFDRSADPAVGQLGSASPDSARMLVS